MEKLRDELCQIATAAQQQFAKAEQEHEELTYQNLQAAERNQRLRAVQGQVDKDTNTLQQGLDNLNREQNDLQRDRSLLQRGQGDGVQD